MKVNKISNTIHDIKFKNVTIFIDYDIYIFFSNINNDNRIEINNTIQVDIEFINSKIEERNEAKKNKNYELADQIRNELLEMGIILKDTREGTTFEIKK